MPKQSPVANQKSRTLTKARSASARDGSVVPQPYSLFTEAVDQMVKKWEDSAVKQRWSLEFGDNLKVRITKTVWDVQVPTLQAAIIKMIRLAEPDIYSGTFVRVASHNALTGLPR